MRRKKVLIERDPSKILFSDNNMVISQLDGNLFFEIGMEVTSDIAEAVSILMRRHDLDNIIWKTEVLSRDVTPEKSLFWLTGGYDEWRSLENYKKPWCDCYLDFQEEFGFIVNNAVRRSNTLGEIRDVFMKYLSLSNLYEFAISKNLIK